MNRLKEKEIYNTCQRGTVKLIPSVNLWEHFTFEIEEQIVNVNT